MRDRDWEMIVDTAAVFERVADAYTGEERWDRLRDELDAIVIRFDCHAADDVPARAVVVLCNAWIAMLNAEHQDHYWRDDPDDEDDAGGAAGAG